MNGNILVIDDETTVRELMSRIIMLEGFSVIQAGTVKEGKNYFLSSILMLCFVM